MGLLWDKKEDRRYTVIKLIHPIRAYVLHAIALILFLITFITYSPIYLGVGVILLLIFALISTIDTGFKISLMLWLGSKRFTKRKITMEGRIFSLKHPIKYKIKK